MGDLFDLRLLLPHRRGAINLKTINCKGFKDSYKALKLLVDDEDYINCKGFKDAYKALKLLVDDKQWIKTITVRYQILDECTMAPLYAYNSLDILFKDFMSNHSPFGGKNSFNCRLLQSNTTFL